MSDKSIDELLKQTFGAPPELPERFESVVISELEKTSHRQSRWRVWVLIAWFVLTALAGLYGFSVISPTVVTDHWVFFVVLICALLICAVAIVVLLRWFSFLDLRGLLDESPGSG